MRVHLQIESILFHADGMLIVAETNVDTFWACFAPNAGWARFEKIEGHKVGKATTRLISQGTFVVRAWQPAHEPAPNPIISLSGVWWTRQAALEAHHAISVYQAAGDLIRQSALQSET